MVGRGSGCVREAQEVTRPSRKADFGNLEPCPPTRSHIAETGLKRRQISPVRSARPLFITVQLVLGFIIAPQDSLTVGSRLGERSIVPMREQFLDMKDASRGVGSRELG